MTKERSFTKEKYKNKLLVLFFAEIAISQKTIEEVSKEYGLSPSSIYDRLSGNIKGERRGKVQKTTKKFLAMLKAEAPLTFKAYKCLKDDFKSCKVEIERNEKELKITIKEL